MLIMAEYLCSIRQQLNEILTFQTDCHQLLIIYQCLRYGSKLYINILQHAKHTHTKKRMSFLTESHQSTVLMISKRLIARMYHDCTKAFCTGITDNETLLALKYRPKIPCNSKIDSRCNLLKVDFRMLTSSCFFSRFENKVTLFRLSVVFLESKSIEFECSNRCFFFKSSIGANGKPIDLSYNRIIC